MSNTTTPRVFTTLDEALKHERHGTSRDGTRNEWQPWRIVAQRDILQGEEYFVWSNCQHVALQTVSNEEDLFLVEKAFGKQAALATALAANKAKDDEIAALRAQLEAALQAKAS